MRQRIRQSIVALVLLLAACAAPTIKDVEPAKPPFREVAATLPFADISEDGSTIRYPDERLYADGSVLPLPGGMDLLDPLIALLLRYPDKSGVATVRSSGHEATYDRLLVEKRLELLEKIFRNRGVTQAQLRFTLEVGGGAPLELQYQLESPLSSSTEKE